MLIGQALKVNPDLINTSETAMLRNLKVPGLLNTEPGGLRKSDKALAAVLRY